MNWRQLSVHIAKSAFDPNIAPGTACPARALKTKTFSLGDNLKGPGIRHRLGHGCAMQQHTGI